MYEIVFFEDFLDSQSEPNVEFWVFFFFLFRLYNIHVIATVSISSNSILNKNTFK